jgi:excisionase family DNA binding protein
LYTTVTNFSPQNLTREKRFDKVIIYKKINMDESKILKLNDSDPKEIIRVSISEAARLFGVNPQTIRRAIQSQDITYVVVAGRYKINFESLVKWSQKKTTVRNKSEKYGIGQYVDKWKIKNTLYSPSKRSLNPEK